MSKYKNQKTLYDGILFDSKREANRYAELKMLERAGAIADLQRQVEFELVPKQYDAQGRMIERAVKYVADFVYTDKGRQVVEDVKGYRRQAVWVVKRKLMLYRHGIKVVEV